MSTVNPESSDLENKHLYEVEKNPEVGDKLLEKLEGMQEEKGVEKFSRRIREFRITIFAVLVLSVVAALHTSEIEDIWRWIKLQAQEMAATGPTLSTDPIGVFSGSFITYTEAMTDIDKDLLLPLHFTSITRFRLDAVRFKAEFEVDKSARTLSNCHLVVEGALNTAEGGIADGNYLTIIQCPGHGPRMLDTFKLIAFPPEMNTLLAPAEYYLREIKGD